MTFELFQRRTLFGKRWYFRLKAKNGEIVATSEAYHNFKDADDTVGLIMASAAFAKVVRC